MGVEKAMQKLPGETVPKCSRKGPPQGWGNLQAVDVLKDLLDPSSVDPCETGQQAKKHQISELLSEQKLLRKVVRGLA